MTKEIQSTRIQVKKGDVVIAKHAPHRMADAYWPTNLDFTHQEIDFPIQTGLQTFLSLIFKK